MEGNTKDNAYVLSIIDKFVKMLKVGHPEGVVMQIMAVDARLSQEDARLVDVMNEVKARLAGATGPLPQHIIALFTSKYERMREKGLSNEKIAYEKYFDDYYGQKKAKSDAPVVYDIPRETTSIGGLNDTVVGDEDEANAHIQSLSSLRAQQFKAEAHHLREQEAQQYFEKHKVEEVSDGLTDNAPLATAVQGEGAQDEQFWLKVQKRDTATPPPVTRSLEYNAVGIDGIERTCTFREHLPAKIFSFQNILSKEQCFHLRKLLDFTPDEENAQNQLLSVAKASNKFLVRTNIRRTFIDLNVARLVWRNVKYYVPAELPDGRKLSGVRTKMNYYRYGPGQFFKTHIDGGFRFTESGDTAWFTFVIYLNDNFEGGSTRFCPLKEDNLPQEDFMPLEGSMLVFQQQDLKHCGVVVESGYKHILQGMVMYGPVRYNSLGHPFGAEPQLFHTTNCDC
eukprot:TRINITY_DN649_c0_g1_i1.p1 TRINITY_DN649_c0_g1~~TRINITY_DN649_c0_g1_i1.p1  ORF type:complete len:452 (-),score=77.42 TRINITY_DN649_c0_g1_i1:33-1388(-)